MRIVYIKLQSDNLTGILISHLVSRGECFLADVSDASTVGLSQVCLMECVPYVISHLTSRHVNFKGQLLLSIFSCDCFNKCLYMFSHLDRLPERRDWSRMSSNYSEGILPFSEWSSVFKDTTEFVKICSVTELAEEVQRLKLRNNQVNCQQPYLELCICFNGLHDLNKENLYFL